MSDKEEKKQLDSNDQIAEGVEELKEVKYDNNKNPETLNG